MVHALPSSQAVKASLSSRQHPAFLDEVCGRPGSLTEVEGE